MEEQTGWMVYTRLDSSSIFGADEIRIEEKHFPTLREAEDYHTEPVADASDSPQRRGAGWQSPIPVVEMNASRPSPFRGAQLANGISFPAVDMVFDQERRVDACIDAIFRDSGADVAEAIMAELELEGQIPGSSDRTAPSQLTSAHFSLIAERQEAHRLPGIECYLGRTWRFYEIASDARRRIAHVTPKPSKTPRNQLLDAATDLENVFLRMHPGCTTQDLYHFWTSLQVAKHLATFCREKLWDRSVGDAAIDDARMDFGRALGSYAHELKTNGGEAALARQFPPLTDQQIIDAGTVSQPEVPQQRVFIAAAPIRKVKRRRDPHPDPFKLFGERQQQTFATAAKATGLSKRALTDKIEEGLLDADGNGAARRITTQSLKNLLNLNPAKPTSPVQTRQNAAERSRTRH